MMNNGDRFHDAVSGILKRDPRYHREAYEFVHRAVHYVQKMNFRDEAPTIDPHIGVAALVEGMRIFALQQFGPMVMDVFAKWGVRNTLDFGNLVFSMAEAGLLGVSEEDKLEQFEDLYDFDEVFRVPFIPSGRKVHVPVVDDE